MRHAKQRGPTLIDQVDLYQTRSRRDLFAILPTEAVSKTMDRDDLGESAARLVLSADIDEIEAAGMRLHGRIAAQPAHDLVRVGQEGKNRRRRGRDMDFTPDHERFSHPNPPSARAVVPLSRVYGLAQEI